MKNPWLIVLGSIAVAAGLIALLLWQSRSAQPINSNLGKPLLVFCAAGIKPPVEAVAHEYEQVFGIRVQIQYGGSGTLLSNLRVADAGDLFLAADESYMKSAREFGLLAETIPLARQRPVIAVARGNPKNIHTLQDLRRADLRVALANPEATSIGRTVRALLQRAGQWPEFEKRITVFKPTVNDVANDVKIGSVDAGIVWDATALQYSELEIVPEPMFRWEEHTSGLQSRS